MRKPTFGQRRGKPVPAPGGYKRPSRLDENFPEARGAVSNRSAVHKPRPSGDRRRDAAAVAPLPASETPGKKRPAPGSGHATDTMRIAKAMARAGLCSRRDAERWIADGRVAVNGKTIASPALDVTPKDRIVVDGEALPDAEPTRLWRFHKPRGFVTTHSDPEGRATVFDHLPKDLPRVVSIGRLDFNTEGLLLLTNDGELARHLELPATGWLRKYRVRCHGVITQARLDTLKDGIEIDGVRYGPIEATVDGHQGGGNVWLTVGLREGKNREVKNILASLDLIVNRLIRVSFGPFQLMDLEEGKAESVKRRVLADQLGPEAAKTFGLDQIPDEPPPRPRKSDKPKPPPKEADAKPSRPKRFR
jgi:23S rRNA pseudouridine2605 synthase